APAARERRKCALEPGDLFRGSDLHGSVYRGHVSQSSGGSHLALVLVERALEDAGQPTGTKLIRYSTDILHALGLAKGTHETSTLHAGPFQQAPLGEDQGP